MLESLGIANRRELLVFACLILLVAVTPLGNEGTHPTILFIHRTLLLGIVAAYAAWTNRAKLQRLCPYFIGVLALIFGIMLVSVIQWPGSLFEGFFAYYTNLFFIAAFIALAHAGAARPARWKLAVLVAVVLINIGYLGAALSIPSPVLQGTFVNPNYLASFLLPGLAVCIAFLFHGSSLVYRAAAAVAALFLFYGITQTSSRGATLAGLALLGLAGFRTARRYQVSWIRIGVAAGLAASLLLGATIALNPTLVRKFLDRGQHDPYNYQRIPIWMSTLSMIGEHPVMGVGLGHYYHFGKRFAPAVEGTIARRSRWPNIAHSEYLQYTAELGIPGALLLFAAGGYLALLACRRATKITAPENGIPQEAAILTIGALSIHAFVDNNWTLPVMSAGMAVISQADLLPYREGIRTQLQSPLWRTAVAILLAAVWLDAAVIPSVGLYYNETGLEHFKADDFDRAETHHRFALAFLPENPVLLDNLGAVYFARYLKTRKSEDLDRAEIYFSDSLKQNPHYDQPAGHLEKALIERLIGDPKHDAPIHERIVETDKLVLKMSPFNPFVRKNLAEGLYNLGKHEEACAELEKALENEPNYIPGYLRLAEWYAAMGREQQSDKYRKHAIQVANLYKDKHSLDEYENLLLGRPEATP
jgi:O-antigen ligase